MVQTLMAKQKAVFLLNLKQYLFLSVQIVKKITKSFQKKSIIL